MDRNAIDAAFWSSPTLVALRKESVDRNIPALGRVLFLIVALRKESVDRNYDTYAKVLRVNESLSARRAWIEIELLIYPVHGQRVALRKESVDRN